MRYLVKLSSAPWYWSNTKGGFVAREKATEYKSRVVANVAASRSGGVIETVEN